MRACLVVPAQAGTHDRRPVFMGPGSPPACAGVGRDDSESRVGKIARVAVAAWATRAFTPVFDGLWAPCDFAHAEEGEQRAFAHSTAQSGRPACSHDVIELMEDGGEVEGLLGDPAAVGRGIVGPALLPLSRPTDHIDSRTMLLSVCA
jgi:hypothetical protein